MGRPSCYFDSKGTSGDRDARDLERAVSKWARNAPVERVRQSLSQVGLGRDKAGWNGESHARGL